MEKKQQKPGRPLSVAVTGASGAMGRLILPRLLAHRQVRRVLALGLEEPGIEDRKLSCASIDITRPTAVQEMAQAFTRHEADAVMHLAFFSGPIRDASYAHEVEAIGTAHVLAATHDAGVRTFVSSSTTMVYGASPKNPNFLVEDRPLQASPGSRYVADKIEAEVQIRRFCEATPGFRACVLRFAPVVGPTAENPFTRALARRLVPTVLGFDPLVQCVHEEDAASAALAALFHPRGGEFNVVGRGVLPLSAVVRLSGARSMPLPWSLANAAVLALNATGLASLSPALLDYIRYLWVADGARAEKELGFKARFSGREAVVAFAQARGRVVA